MRPKAPSAQQLQKGKALLRALPKLKRPAAASTGKSTWAVASRKND